MTGKLKSYIMQDCISLVEKKTRLDLFCLPLFALFISFFSVSGSVYEISGCEVSFSTGDLIKVIGLELLSICCEDFNINERFELPINHTGLSADSPQNSQLNACPKLTTDIFFRLV